MTNKKLISKSELDSRIAKADISNLEYRQQHFFGVAAMLLYTLVVGTVVLTCFNGDGTDSKSSCAQPREGGADK